MKIHLKQTRANLFFSAKTIISLFAIVLFIALSSSVSFAPTKISPKAAKMSESELADIDAQAFFKIDHYASTDLFWTTPSVISSSTEFVSGVEYTSFQWPDYTRYNTGSDNVIRISLDMEVQAHGFVAAQKHGYRYGMQGGVGLLNLYQDQWGWDIDFPNFWVGDRSPDGTGAPLKLDGIILDVGFDNIGDNATRTLNYIEVGSLHTTGNVTQTLERVNGLFIQGGTGTNNGVAYRQTASGTRVVNFNNQVFTFVFANKYDYMVRSGDTPPRPIVGTFVKIPNYHTDNDLHRPGDAGGW